MNLKAYKEVCKILNVKPSIIKEIPDVPDATTVVVPNQVFSWDQIKKLAIEFGKKQPYKTYIYEELYKLYSAEELSGKVDGKAAYRVIYIPNKYNVEVAIAEIQAKKHKDDHVPSPLEAVCFWFTLRELGKPLDFDSTYIRHFNLPEQRFGVFQDLPSSYVFNDGRPYFSGSLADDRGRARVAVGSKLEASSSSSATALSSPADYAHDTLAVELLKNTDALNRLNETLERVFK